MEKRVKRRSYFEKILLLSIVSFTVLSIVLSVCHCTIFILDDNQLLYLFSTMAQVTGGMFGLTLTAYVFFIDKFKRSTRDDDTLYDATSALLNRYFHILILVATISGITISLCILGIIDLHNWMSIYPFIINECVLVFLIGISAILIFGMMLLDPQKLDKELGKMKKDAERYYQSTSTSGDFREFLKNYNLLEHLIVDFASEYMKHQISFDYSPRNSRPQIIQSLQILCKNEILTASLVDELNELRMYRNGLVHGVNFTVSQDVCDRVLTIYNTLNQAFDVFKNKRTDSREREIAIKKVHNLSR